MKILKIETNLKRNLYLKETEVKHTKKYDGKPENNVLNIYKDLELQQVLGFGGAFTDSTCYVLNKISSENKDKIINEYFGENSLNYSLGRLTIGSSDFNQKSYSYSYKKDLSDFSINEDMNYIIPIIKKAQSRNKDIKFLASPWSPPAFMKTNKMLKLGGRLNEKYYSLWAEYLAKYVLEYQKQNISINYMTIQNEPNATQIWESCKFTAEEEASFLKQYLYPTFKKNNLNTKFLVWDHNKDNIVNRNIDTLVKYGALDYAEGIAFHWYTGTHFENLQILRNLFPNKLLIHTEGCTGYSKFKPEDELFNAEMYASQIIGDFNSGVNGFIDWNMVLDNKGGPNHVKNYCNSPIMLNKDNTDYIKTPSFYYIAQFSKYINPGAKRIAFSRFTENIDMTAFKNPDNSVVVILLNRNNYNIEYNLCFQNQYFHDNLDSKAIVTFIIKE
ncbi:MAG: glycoside hydrolase family 30 protein [Clostridia bacterium]|nr:glycoside hydrolase family 30 protein [Clostridia bacterium]